MSVSIKITTQSKILKNINKTEGLTIEPRFKPIVFISHRSIDKGIADIIFDFLIGTGIPRECLFCSSLPGNDIGEKISSEVKANMRNSVVNIAILSHDYYQSPYCINEAGIIWFCDKVPVIPVALPDISQENMCGFLSNEYKIRRLSCDNDVAYMYDTVRAAVSAQQCKASIVSAETSKLKIRFEDYIEKRLVHTDLKCINKPLEVSSDDEAVVLYYILLKKVRKVKKSDITSWMIDEELYDINVDNALDLLSTLGKSKYANDILELDIDLFRQYSSNADDLAANLSVYIKKHKRLSRDTFETLWLSGKFYDAEKLFISYIIDEQITTFGDRWMTECQIQDIKSWESKYNLDDFLSETYVSCLSVFIENHLVHESSWTSYGNPREHSLHESLKRYLFGPSFPHTAELEKAKQNHTFELPF